MEAFNERATWEEIGVGDTLELEGWAVDVGPANHTVPCLSFAFRRDGVSVAIVGDTRRDEAVIAWTAEQKPDCCVVEVSYPDALSAKAVRFGHQSAADLADWRSALGPECRICVTHMKPKHETVVRAECEAIEDPNLHILTGGDVIQL